MPRGNDQTHFGYETVPLDDKQERVDDVFHSVARRYDLMNDLMSGGLHRAWKDALVTAVNPPKSRRANLRCSIWPAGPATSLSASRRAGGPGTRVTVCDINADMLEVGRERARPSAGSMASSPSSRVMPKSLPYADRSFDCVTIAFGIRNVPRIERALARSLSRAQDRRPIPVP